jgi:hypothetical protein
MEYVDLPGSAIKGCLAQVTRTVPSNAVDQAALLAGLT